LQIEQFEAKFKNSRKLEVANYRLHGFDAQCRDTAAYKRCSSIMAFTLLYYYPEEIFIRKTEYMMNIRALCIIIVLPLLCLACISNNKPGKKENDRETIQADTSITPVNAFNRLFLDSSKLQNFLDKHSDFAPYQQQFFDFYKIRNYEYAWFDTGGISEHASNFMNLLNMTIIEENDSSLYNKKLAALYSSFVTDSTKHEEVSPLQTELYLTGQLFTYVSKVYNNKDVDAADLGWFIPKKKFDFTRLVDSVVVTKGKNEDKYLPLNPQYKELQEALAKYYNIQKNESWDSIPKPKKNYKAGDSAVTIARIKHRLYLLGDLPEDDTTKQYTATLSDGVTSFQHRMGLKETGIIDAATMHELNYPIRSRIKQIVINLERMRWLPAESDSNYIVVNIPEYKLYVYDNGKPEFDMNVIVGKEGTGTVIFTGKLKYVVFSPYWNVPPSIVKKEILPEMDKNPDYLEEQNMEVTKYENDLPVVRQKPGENNSLGLVKFLFPNNYNIYLHDTPFKDLFSKQSRSFSHGCVRLEDATKMALYLLRDDPSYTKEKVDSLMHLDHEKWVTIKKPVRVSIVYFTSWVDDEGKVNFRKDIYGHDEDMAEKLFVRG
jgi:murein L,D-transpeptidase YcbB/YkuD